MIVAQRDFSQDPHHHLAIDVRVRAHSGTLEGSAKDKTTVISNSKDGRPAGLFDLDDLPLDHDRLAYLALQICCLGEGKLLLHLDYVVLLQLGRLELNIAIGKNISHGYEYRVA